MFNVLLNVASVYNYLSYDLCFRIRKAFHVWLEKVRAEKTSFIRLVYVYVCYTPVCKFEMLLVESASRECEQFSKSSPTGIYCNHVGHVFSFHAMYSPLIIHSSLVFTYYSVCKLCCL